MQLKDIFEGLGDFFIWAFGGLEFLGNIPNILISVIIFVLFIYWMLQMRKHSEAGEH